MKALAEISRTRTIRAQVIISILYIKVCVSNIMFASH